MKLDYKDEVTIYRVDYNGFGDETIADTHTLLSLFVQHTGTQHSSNVDIIESDAHIYLDHEDTWILDNYYRLEGYYIKINMHGSTDRMSWYKITRCLPSMDKLLTNTLDNVHCYLKKTEALEES